MATKKAAATKTAAPAKKAVVVKKAVAAKKAAAPKKVAATKTAPAKKAAVGATLKPVKDQFTKSSLMTHVATQSGVEPKQVKAVFAALEDTILGSVHKKGLGEFTLSGLLKINVQKVEAKKRRFGKDPFTGEERWFDAKPASVRLKVRALKKLKDAAA
ncbi:HU family DNA-binding protein [Caballeronia grimmiae]|uniref:HU family DNA-binding protein n=1 Tax=Caballeronia grimmiae TaxID=1071679 RepID=UPI0038B705FD